MSNFTFHEIPDQYKAMIDNISNNMIKNLYSRFTFKYYKFEEQKSLEIKDLGNRIDLFLFLFDYLKSTKFITYHTSNFSDINDNSSINESLLVDTNLTSKTNCIFCLENECVIIEQIDEFFFENLIYFFQKNRIHFLNVSNSSNLSIRYSENEKIEIQNFCKYYKNEIKSNKFVKYTIDSIVGYLIRRYFYPSSYFDDNSFFNFKYSSSNEFQEKDFIILRTIFHKYNRGTYYLVIHRESLYIFMMYKFQNPKSKTREINHEIQFCESYSHYCLTKSYGFIKENNAISGIIYEYMCNSDLETYILNNDVNELFILITIYRISQGIDYLHSNNLIHRDLKPLNILVDHDRLPYISDFETIRSPSVSDEDPITNDIGSQLYSSPEQDLGIDVSFPTDIFSFGLIIYFLFEKQHMFSSGTSKCNNIKSMKKGSINIRNLYDKCVKLKPNERIKSKKILEILNTEFNIFFYSIQQYEKFLKMDDSEALLFLGFIYENGFGVKQDFTQAKEYYEQSAEYNNSYALLNLGIMYSEGIGVKQNYLQAKEYYERSAKLNNRDALLNIGILYSSGHGVTKSYSQARKYFEQSAKLGDSNALLYLGNFYVQSLGVHQNFPRAIEYYKQSAELGNSAALVKLGNCYAQGLGVKQDYVQAKEYFEKAAKFDNKDAFLNLGIIYAQGLGIKQDYTKTKEYFEKSSKLGNLNALLYLGDLYEKGLGVTRDYSRAKYYYEQAAALGNSNAFLYLGDLYAQGFGVEQDYSQAKMYYEKSSKLGNPTAFLNLGNLYANGLGVKQDYLKAKELYEQSAKSNNSQALSMLGIFYYYGLGVRRDNIQAKSYFKQAAKYDHPYAIFMLANLYSNDEVYLDFKKAEDYYLKSIIIENGFATSLNQSKNNLNIQTTHVCNNLRYISYNNLGIIYLTIQNNIKEGGKCLKESAFAEYPLGQNNFGIFNQFYLSKNENAKYMYKRSAKNKFSMAEFNLGHMKEKEEKIDKSIKYFIQTSDHENEQIEYRNISFIDKRLEISKKFIICLANLKLVEYYFSIENYDESKKYFERSINNLQNFKLENFEYRFYFRLKIVNEMRNEYPNNTFSYLKKYILNFPPFNLMNHPNLKTDTFIKIFHNINHNIQIEEKPDQMEKVNDQNNNSSVNPSLLGIQVNPKENNYDLFKKVLKIESPQINLNEDINIQNDQNDESLFVNEIFFEKPNDLFDFIIRKSQLRIEPETCSYPNSAPKSKLATIFIKEIREIIKIMEMILYTPPYYILFSFVWIEKDKGKEDDSQKDINQSFYDGFTTSNIE